MKALKKLYLALILIFMYAPIAVLILYSFNASRSRSVWGGFSLKWYEELMGNYEIRDAVLVSVSIAVLATLISVILGWLLLKPLGKTNLFK